MGASLTCRHSSTYQCSGGVLNASDFPVLLRFTRDQCFCLPADLELNHSWTLYNNLGQREITAQSTKQKTRWQTDRKSLGFGTIENQSPKRENEMLAVLGEIFLAIWVYFLLQCWYQNGFCFNSEPHTHALWIYKCFCIWTCLFSGKVPIFRLSLL